MSAVLRRRPGCKKRRAAFIPAAMFAALGSRIDSADVADDSRLIADAYRSAGERGLSGDAQTIAALEQLQQHYRDQASRIRNTREVSRFNFEWAESCMSRSYDMRAALRRFATGAAS